jgi:hypothetical protein
MRLAKRPSNEFSKEAQREETKRIVFPRRKTGLLPNFTARPFVTKHEIPIRKIPHPSLPLSSL